MQGKHWISALALTAGLVMGGSAFAQTTVRIAWYSDGNEGEVVSDLLKRFEAQNKDIKVVLDQVPYKAITENLPVQLASGQGPDIARVVDLGGIARYALDMRPHLKDAAYWEKNFGPFLPWMRPEGDDKAITGFMTQLTVSGPFVNKTLFEQAKVPMPGPKATWDEWVDAARKVAKATQTPAAMAWDRSGHRFAGPAASYGAKFFDAKGGLALDAGYKNTVSKFVAWHKDGTMLKDVWGGSGGSSYADGVGEFKNGRLVMILSGSWQIGRMQREIGNAFDWVAVPNPCGTAACSGMPGGAAWVALKTTKSPKEVGQFLDFMAQETSMAEFSARTNNITAHAGLAKKGVSYPTASPAAQAALEVFSNGTGTLAPAAYALQGYRYNRALMLPTVTRVTQAIVGEITVDEATNKITADMTEAVKQAEK